MLYRGDRARRERNYELTYQRDGRRCRKIINDGERCPSIDDLTIDHVIPQHLGGTDEIDNLRVMCRSHNSAAGARVGSSAHPCPDYLNGAQLRIVRILNDLGTDRDAGRRRAIAALKRVMFQIPKSADIDAACAWRRAGRDL